MFRRSPKLVVAAVVAVAVVVGVVLAVTLSSGGGKPSGPTKAQYLARADAICKTTAAKINPLIGRAKADAPALLTGGSGAQLVPIFRRLEAAAAGGLAQLRALPEPSGDHAAIQAFLVPLGGVVTALGDAAGDLGSGNTGKAIQLFTQTLQIAPQVTSAAQAYGYTACSQLVAALRA